MDALSVLVLDDEKKIIDQIAGFLQKKKYQTFSASSPQEAFAIMEGQHIDILISDIMMPEMNGLEVLQKIKAEKPSIEVIMISGHGDMDSVIEAMRRGAVDYLRKPFGPLDIQLAIERTGKYLNLQNTLKRTQDRLHILENRNSLISRELENLIEKEFIGSSKAIRNVLDLALKAAEDKDISIMITGENGTGKEIIARIIHYASTRKEFPFYPINSSAVPETLLESEFFGHVKGAFTGADKNKHGCFVLAEGGTLFLDEIADMPVNLQAKLLRVLEEKKVKQIGGNREIAVDVRIISATNCNIDDLVREKKFRLDLFHRINTLKIDVPPLRERSEDIEPLISYFLQYFSRKKNLPVLRVDKNVITELKKYPFPGNVRELRNMVERALILRSGETLDLKDFNLNRLPLSDMPVGFSYNLEKQEIETIKKALLKTDYNQSQAARLLGVSKDALFRRIKKYHLEIRKELT
ncbi:MAG: sigma-54-dependent Fis family transcriptional regulator [Candidatus Cloacimonetes bacterium]|nr:sigma-54-dependent Fis family transcriptional regulator [Candidatus Cloacimonadota bacterium]